LIRPHGKLSNEGRSLFHSAIKKLHDCLAIGRLQDGIMSAQHMETMDQATIYAAALQIGFPVLYIPDSEGQMTQASGLLGRVGGCGNENSST
jgi:hypothetical protein